MVSPSLWGEGIGGGNNLTSGTALETARVLPPKDYPATKKMLLGARAGLWHAELRDISPWETVQQEWVIWMTRQIKHRKGNEKVTESVTWFFTMFFFPLLCTWDFITMNFRKLSYLLFTHSLFYRFCPFFSLLPPPPLFFFFIFSLFLFILPWHNKIETWIKNQLWAVVGYRHLHSTC